MLRFVFPFPSSAERNYDRNTKSNKVEVPRGRKGWRLRLRVVAGFARVRSRSSKRVDPPDIAAGRVVFRVMNGVHDGCDVYVNDAFIGSVAPWQVREFSVTHAINLSGNNRINILAGRPYTGSRLKKRDGETVWLHSGLSLPVHLEGEKRGKRYYFLQVRSHPSAVCYSRLQYGYHGPAGGSPISFCRNVEEKKKELMDYKENQVLVDLSHEMNPGGLVAYYQQGAVGDWKSLKASPPTRDIRSSLLGPCFGFQSRSTHILVAIEYHQRKRKD